MVVCKRCGNDSNKIELAPKNSPHYGKIYCNVCEKYLGFAKKPINEEKRTKSTKYTLERIIREKGFKEPICFFCNRNIKQLGLNQTLEIDHIIPIVKGGEDEINNINILCSCCHKLKHLMVTHINYPFTGKLP
jgi:hypothetical protein